MSTTSVHDTLTACTSRAAKVAKIIHDNMHYNMHVVPSEVNWGHVGTAAHAVAKLEELAKFLGLELPA